MNLRVVRRFMLVSLIALATQILPVSAGTTGSLNGTISSDNAPLAGVIVIATSPSQTTTTSTDGTGHFAFVSLAPDTYTVSAQKNGYDTLTRQGVTVVADNNQTIELNMQRALRTIANLTSAPSSNLVRPGTTADVYSINEGTQQKVSALGGGGNLNTAYSAIASVPGVYTPVGQQGWLQDLYIRGGDYNQVGYELDGIPISRSFDNYPGNTLSSIGQQEVQLYTGAAPANANAQGIAGFVNQVIKTGTYPGTGTADLGTGLIGQYNKGSIEAGGATPNRSFSYYVGLEHFKQAYKFIDQSDGAALSSTWGMPFFRYPCGVGPPRDSNAACYLSGIGPGGYVFGPMPTAGNYTAQPIGGNTTRLIADSENVANFHFALPHRYNSGRDDVQLLYETYFLHTEKASSTAEHGLPLYQQYADALFAGGLVPNNNIQNAFPKFAGGFQYNGQMGVALPMNYQELTVPYIFPNETAACLSGCIVPYLEQDGENNSGSIIKAQYQHNIGSNAYWRLYAYSFYSDWFSHGPNTYASNYAFWESADYSVDTHTAGMNFSYSNQFNDKHLLNFQGNYVVGKTYQTDIEQVLNSCCGFGQYGTNAVAQVVDAKHPTNGICYNLGLSGPIPTDCFGSATFATITQAHSGSINMGALNGLACGTGPCEYYVTNNGANGNINDVKAVFPTLSLSDQYRASSKLMLNVGLRFDQFQFHGADTTGPARDFWFNAWNQDYCVQSAQGSIPVTKTQIGIPVTSPCPQGYTIPTMTNASAQVLTFNELQPRFGGTYSLNSDNVLRFSAGKYAQAPIAAFEQYNDSNQNLVSLLGSFYQYGFTTPGHAINPQVSWNYDASWEHRFKNSSLSLKISPFFRKTSGQIEQFILDPVSRILSGLNVGKQTSEGVELQIVGGDFSKNGFAGSLSYTYTNSYINYTSLPNGANLFVNINNDVKTYNAYTSRCASNPTDPRCGSTTNNLPSAPCYGAAGTPQPTCPAGSVANPYWNAPVQNLFDPNAKYVPYDTVPFGFNSLLQSFIEPHVLSLVLNYAHNRWAITPSLQFAAGGYYGGPEQTPGIDPASSCAPLVSGSTQGDPRYPYGAAGGAPYDATTCGSLRAIPNTATGQFDTLGQFRQPSRLTMQLQGTYNLSSSTTARVTFTNIVDTCFGGSREPWTVTDSRVCSYGGPGWGTLPPAGNFYNPTSQFQTQVKYPYTAEFTHLPFSIFLDVQFRR